MTEPWHALTAEAVLDDLQTDRQQGLSEPDAARRLAADGPNEIPRPRPVPAWRRFLTQFHNILIYVLLASAVGAFALGDGIDAWVILGVVLINAIIGYIQEDKAETALAAIRDLLSLAATPIRDGSRRLLAADQLVAGDLVILQAGDKVPADLRLVDLKNLGIDESALTGESGAVFKSVAPLPADTSLADRNCMAYSGSLVVSGQALGVVVATGARTELGRISALLSRVQAVETPLQRQFAAMARWLTLVILILSGAVFAYGMWGRGHDLQEMFMAMVAIAVAAVPEGLPAVVTITLAVGVQRMARRHAIVRHLPAVETLGQVTVICSDKTGTLTGNLMTVHDIVTAHRQYVADGAGYGGAGRIYADGSQEPVAVDADLRQLIRIGLLCNDACLHPHEGGVKLDGDPTEGALLALGLKAGMEQRQESVEAPRVDCIPFESERRIMATLHRLTDGSALVCLKGAPEAVLPLCTEQSADGMPLPLDRVYWNEQAERLAKGGERVLAAAYRSWPQPPETLERAITEGGMVLAGLCGLIDPPRQEAIQAIRSCREAHIRVKMITGDHGLTARAIGTRMNLSDHCRVLLGSRIEAMSDAELAAAVRRNDIFARTSPEHKLRLVQALQSDGHVVAMTGDGVNDAPALKAADIGVAMGMKGSEVAKDAAVMVLADDNFASIAHAVEEGRTLHDNLLKAIVFILPTSFAQAGAVVVGLLLGVTLPITPLQILWVNLVTAVTLSVSLAFEPPEAGVMKRPPRRSGKALLGWFSLWRILFVTALLVAGLMGVYLYETAQGASIAESRAAAVNALVVGEIVYLFNSRYIESSVLSFGGLLGNRYAIYASLLLLVLQLVMTYAPWMQDLFGTAALGADAWLRIGAFAAAVFLVVEVEKLLLRLVKRCCGMLTESGDHPGRPRDRKSLTRFAWLSIAAAVVTIILKTAAYSVTGSVGLLSDALESLVNLVAAMMALAMLMVAERPPDDKHHYGHGKAEYFSSGLEGALIILAAAGIGLTAYDRLQHPQPLADLDLGVAISAIAACINFGVASVLLRVGRRYGSITLEADARHLLTDVWTSVGVVLGLGAVFVTGWDILDPLIALVVAANVVWSGFALLTRSVAGLLDATLPAAENARIAAVLDAHRQQGIEFHDLRTRQSGVYRFMTVHVLVPGSISVQAGHDLVDRIEREIRAAVGEITVVSHLEPLEDPASFNHDHRVADEADVDDDG